MADYDLGSVGYDVEIRGVSKSISDLRTIDENFKKVTKTLNDFKSTDVYSNVANRLDKVKTGTTQWISLERQRQNLILSNMRFERQAAQQELRDNNAILNSLGDKIAMMRRSGSLDAAMGRNTKGIQMYGMAIQQTGYQVGDFLVQVQSGTNAFVAFGQQATQLTGLLFLMNSPMKILGMSLSGWGLALSIAIPLLTAIGAYWMRTRKNVDDYGGAIKRAVDEQKRLNEETLKLKFPNVADQLKSQIDVAKVAVVELKAKMDELQNSKSPWAGQAAGGIALTEGISHMFGQGPNAELEAAQKLLNDLLTAQGALIAENDKKQEKGAEIARRRAEFEKRVRDYQAEMAFKEANALQEKIAYNQTIGRQVASQMQLHVLEMNTDHDRLGIVKMISSEISGSVLAGNALLSAANNMTGPFASIANFAKNIGTYLWNAAGIATGLTDRAPGGVGPAGMDISGGVTERQRRLAANQAAALNPNYSSPISGSSSGSGGGAVSDPLGDLRKQIELQKELYNKTSAQKEVIQAMGIEWYNANTKIAASLVEEIQKQDELNAKLEQQQAIWDSVSNSMTDGFMSMVEGTASVKDAFKKMAYDIIEELYKVLVVQQMVSSFGTILGGSGGGASLIGTLTSAMTGHATGGNMTAGQPYMVGEQGPEIIVPSTSGKVLTNSQSKDAMSGGGSVTVQNNITVTGSDAAMVRQTVVQMLPQITQASMNGIVDAKRRGGRVGSVFN
jgi:hypothetical protein